MDIGHSLHFRKLISFRPIDAEVMSIQREKEFISREWIVGSSDIFSFGMWV